MLNPTNYGSEIFRATFAEQITDFFGQNFDYLQPRERAHAIGVVANTLAALAVNQAQRVDVDGMINTLATLNEPTNATIEKLVVDDAVSLLFPQSRGICDVLRTAIAERQEKSEQANYD